MATGFAALNTFKRNVRRLAQLYDFAYALYLDEVPRLREALKGAKPGHSLHTTLGTITHSVERLYEQAKRQFPDRLRSLLLVSLVAQLEAFLTDLVREIASRDLSPFADSQPVELPRGKILTAASINALQEHIIDRDRRRLTSGGLQEMEKYFRARFKIDFGSLPVPFEPIQEIHARRHLHVHSDGIADAQYAREFAGTGVGVGDRLNVDHQYLLVAFETAVQFATEVAGAAMKGFPNQLRSAKSLPGKLSIDPTAGIHLFLVSLDVEASPQPSPSDLLAMALPPHGSFPGGTLAQYTHRILCKDRNATLVLGVTESRFRGIMGALKRTSNLVVRAACAI